MLTPQRKTPAYLTISVDDGHPSDLRAADLLQELGLAATFYIPRTNGCRSVMSDDDLRDLGSRFELGSHTLTHPTLTQLSEEGARHEIRDGKAWLEDVAGTSIDTFCYPRGKVNRSVVRLVAEAGFVGARTCRLNLMGRPRNPYLWGASTQALSHSRAIQTRHAALEHNWRGLVDYLRVFRATTAWDEHFLLAARAVEEKGGIAHLWFHGWEIERDDAWGRLEVLLRRLAGDFDLSPVTNGALFRGA